MCTLITVRITANHQLLSVSFINVFTVTAALHNNHTLTQTHTEVKGEAKTS